MAFQDRDGHSHGERGGGAKCLDVEKEEKSEEEGGGEKEENLWGQLPEDLVQRVMMWLPAHGLLRARSVCKNWESLIDSRIFSERYCQIRPRSTWLMLFPESEVPSSLVYDPDTKRWFDFPLSFLPHESRVVAAAGGLLCLMPKSSASSCSNAWYVCNPISRMWVSLPRPPRLFKLFFLVVGMSVDSGTGSFEVVMAGSELVAEDSERFILTTEVFESRTCLWRKGGDLFLDAPVSPWKAVSGGALHCVTGSAPYRVLSYNTRGSEWSEIKAPMPSNLISVKLMDFRDNLLMIGGLGSHNFTRDVGFWELNRSTMEWKDLGRLPRHICDKLFISQSKCFSCVGEGDYIYFSSKRCPQILEFNLCDKSWNWLPVNRRIFTPYYYMLRGFCFLPRLYTGHRLDCGNRVPTS